MQNPTLRIPCDSLTSGRLRAAFLLTGDIEMKNGKETRPNGKVITRTTKYTYAISGIDMVFRTLKHARKYADRIED